MKKEMVMEFIKKHKVKLGIGIAALVIASGGIVFATVNTPNTAVEAEAEVVKKDVAVEDIEVDYLQYVKGLRDWTVAVGLKDVNFLEGVEWDKEYIKNVTVDDSKVKLDTAGEYEITYSVEVVDKKADDLTIKKTVTVKVISEEEAKVAVEEGQEVVTENGIQNKKEAKASSVNDKGVSASQEVKNEGSKNNGNNTSSSEGTSSGNASTGSSGGSSSSGSNGSGSSSNSKPSGGNSGNSGNTGNSGGSGSVDTHKHSYTIPITEIVHHDAITHQEDQGHYETVTISEAWDEDVYENHTVCYTCGNNTIIDGQAGAHQIWHAERGETCRYGTASIVVDTIHHPAETEQQWIENWVTVVDKEAWDETVTVGYKCSCGAEQK
jgi:hypothetical protein